MKYSTSSISQMRQQRQREVGYLCSITQLVREWPGFKEKHSPILTIPLQFFPCSEPCFPQTFICPFTQAGWYVGRRVDSGIRKPRNTNSTTTFLGDRRLVPEPFRFCYLSYCKDWVESTKPASTHTTRGFLYWWRTPAQKLQEKLTPAPAPGMGVMSLG